MVSGFFLGLPTGRFGLTGALGSTTFLGRPTGLLGGGTGRGTFFGRPTGLFSGTFLGLPTGRAPGFFFLFFGSGLVSGICSSIILNPLINYLSKQ
ncbi:hypothetical protein [Pseudomonas phage Astolliot]|nr:hypothetical protein [Pseudomonas phage Astolliot]